MTTPENPYGPPQRPAPPQQASHRGAPEQQAGGPAGDPQRTHARPPAGTYPSAATGRSSGHGGPQWNDGGRHGQQGSSWPQRGADRSGREQPSGPQVVDPRWAYASPSQGPARARDVREIPPQPAHGRAPGHPSYPSGRGTPAPRNGFGTTALVLGIIGAVFAFIPFVGVIAWPLVILGLIFGILGIVRAGSGRADNRGVAISGTVLSAVGLVVCVVWVSAFGAAVSGATPATSTAPNGSAVPAVSADASTPAAFPGSTPNDVTGSAGDALTVGDVQVSATPLTAGDSPIGETLCSTVTYTNTGSAAGTFNGIFDWKLQDPAGAALMPGLLGSSSILSAGDLAPGGKTSGDVCFDRTGDAAGRYVLLFDPMDFSSARGAWLDQVG